LFSLANTVTKQFKPYLSAVLVRRANKRNKCNYTS